MSWRWRRYRSYVGASGRVEFSEEKLDSRDVSVSQDAIWRLWTDCPHDHSIGDRLFNGTIVASMRWCSMCEQPFEELTLYDHLRRYGN